MAWQITGNNPLAEASMTSLPEHISFTQPLWVHIVAKRDSSSSVPSH